MSELTPDEARTLAETLASLRGHGYVEIEQHERLRPGTRVRHVGHQWPEAYSEGTGVVLAITECPDSSWSKSWHAPDVELVVLWDKPEFGKRLSQLAQYHVRVVDR